MKKAPSQYWFCDEPELTLIARNREDVQPLLTEVERLQQAGYLVAGWISYEAASAFDNRMPSHDSDDFPLIQLMATREFKVIDLPQPVDEPQQESQQHPISLKPRISQGSYLEKYAELIDLIHAGDLYQANFSFRGDVEGVADGFKLFCQLEAHHPVPYSAYIATDDIEVLSMSPELFLSKRGTRVVTEPMKGTASRGLTFEQDEAQRQWLETDLKNRAENVMIVDLMRNDLSKICEANSVTTSCLFSAKRFPSLHQMTSRVSGELCDGINLYELLRATFPAGSITGTPKIRAMEVIHELESDARKVYTGSLGVFLPGGDIQLNVAIRTLVIEKSQGVKAKAELGIGSGVVSPSSALVEWNECLLKGEFLNYRQRHTEIFETLLWEQEGYAYLTEHLERLSRSCEYFLVPFSIADAKTLLNKEARQFVGPTRVRFAVKQKGQMWIASVPLDEIGWNKPGLSLMVSNYRVNAMDVYQHHKTDCRGHYDTGLQQAVSEGCDEMLFFNEENELVEGAITNVFVKLGGRWCTPPLHAGALPGIWRQQMLLELPAEKRTIHRTELANVEEMIVGNSVRGLGKVSSLEQDGQVIWSCAGFAP